MTWAPGITLRPWTVGGTTTTEAGEPLFTRAKITASRSLMLWGATGWRYESATKTITSTEGTQLSAESPVCDQSGWRTENNAIIDVSVEGSYTHTYTIKVSQFRMDANNREIPVGVERTYANVYIPTGDLSPFDLDTMLPVSTVAGGVVLLPDALSARVDALEAGGTGGAGGVGLALWSESAYAYPARPDAPMVMWRGPVDPGLVAGSGFLASVDLWAQNTMAAAAATTTTTTTTAATTTTTTTTTATTTTTTTTAGWTPADLLVDRIAWYNAATVGVADGATVSTWADSYGLHDASGPAGAEPTAQTVNGVRVARFSGAARRIATTAFTLEAQPITYALLVKFAATPTAYQIALGGASVSETKIMSNASGMWAVQSSVGSERVSPLPVSASAFQTVVVVFDGAATTLRVDGASWTVPDSVGTGGLTQIFIGGPSTTMQGDIAEAVIIGRAVTGTDLTSLETYLNNKKADLAS